MAKYGTDRCVALATPIERLPSAVAPCAKENVVFLRLLRGLMTDRGIISVKFIFI